MAEFSTLPAPERIFNKLIEAYVDIETGGDELGNQPADPVRSDETGRVYQAGKSPGVSGVSPWVWLAGLGGLGLVYLLASR